MKLTTSARKWLGHAARAACAAIGVALMAAPSVLGYGAPAATIDRIFGPLIATFAIVAITEATRPARHVNLVLGVGLAIASLVAGGGTTPILTGAIAGALVAALSRVRGVREHDLAGGWSALWR